MGKLLYGVALFCLVIGMVDASGGSMGSPRALEAGILLLLTPVFAVAGLWASRASSKKCPQCAERVKKQAVKCRHCGGSIA
ncbi:hypothetical protein QFZ99_004697 [Paraburkholderia atlantica]